MMVMPTYWIHPWSLLAIPHISLRLCTLQASETTPLLLEEEKSFVVVMNEHLKQQCSSAFSGRHLLLPALCTSNFGVFLRTAPA